ncbi:MAG TPA: hypothetical protein VFU05_17490 [Cyclobacteriaceae bacterium]|nr:hypothetical protein [Cyclobacteriaceae bacterium]
MNYFNLLARGLLILYGVFLLFFALGEHVAGEGFIHAASAILIFILLAVLKARPVLSSLIFLGFFIFSVWFFKTYHNFISFSIISLPLAIASVLFMMGKRFASNEQK